MDSAMSRSHPTPTQGSVAGASCSIVVPNQDEIQSLSEEESECPSGRSHPRRIRQPNSNARLYSISFREDGGSFIEEIAPRSGRRTPSQKSQPGRPRRSSVALPTETGADFEVNETAPLLSKSVGSPSYSSMTDGKVEKPRDGSPFIFCIHGNKFGVARCCEEMDMGANAGVQSLPTLGHGIGNDGFTVDIADGQRDEHDHDSGTSRGLHCHANANPPGVDKRARNKLLVALVLCVVFMIIEILGGVFSGSLAIMTDAAHLLTDIAAFCVSLFSIYMASRPATQTMSFGYHRIEVLGAIVSVLLIWLVTGALVIVAIERIINKDFEINAGIMLLTSGLGLLFNIVMGCTLHQHAHSHGGEDHGHSHASGENINVTAAYIHVIGDFIQSLGVFVAALLIYFKPEWHLADPICTFLFSFLVLATTANILKRTLQVLMEGIPNGVSFQVVQDALNNIEGIVSVHNIRIWSLTTQKIAMSAHLAIAPGTNAQAVLMEASQKIRSQYDIHEMTLQVEDYMEDMKDCTNCQNPVK
eukprot:maker-scaffold99_size374999-snap-gene-2.26 protein:Tk10058 transcript:maker-scaffold99_size374999-snap-gene-2.26-mRNA-1 annotation:"zinc transporter 2"